MDLNGKLIAVFILFVVLFAHMDFSTAQQRARGRSSMKSPTSGSKLSDATRDATYRLLNQSSASGGLQAKLRWSDDSSYVLELVVGNPARNVSLIIDTYDMFIWTDCLQSSMHSSAPAYYPSLSSSYRVLPCNNLQWRKILFYDYPYCIEVPPCTYNCSWALGVLANETFGFGGSNLTLSFGCNNVQGFNYSYSSGYAGIGRGPLSLISQLSFSKFSYCFTDTDTSLSSYMFFGSDADLDENEVVNTTSFAKESNNYILDLRGISLGEKLLPIPAATLQYAEKTNGTIIYSTDQFTYLVPEAYRILREEVISQIGLPVYNRSSDIFDIDLCFNWTSNKALNLSTMTYHFSEADMTLPIQNFLQNDTDDDGTPVVCLMMDKYDDGYSYLGSYQMKNFQFVFDLVNYKLSFRSTPCDQLQPLKSHATKFHLHGATLFALILLYLFLP